MKVQRPKQTVASLPSNYKATEKEAFEKQNHIKILKQKVRQQLKQQILLSGSNLQAGSFGISDRR